MLFQVAGRENVEDDERSYEGKEYMLVEVFVKQVVCLIGLGAH